MRKVLEAIGSRRLTGASNYGLPPESKRFRIETFGGRHMKRSLFAVLALTLSLGAVSMPISAHHGTAAYDTTKVITVKATITQFDWQNPHCEIHFDVTDEQGRLQHWIIETHPPSMMDDRGWHRKSLNPGDVVTLTLHPAKNGANTGILVKVVLPNGQELKHDN
jgi:hypothetical protein